ncbi:enoyl-CoA hydratase-related protein [Temperatibacter marinus]|uniref:enoyl-CoA hydratase n=1 Tax=Temperatibacter marinus TaxID=1456591 RepID=A0AA52HA28_9PROT|nr:enoyl-CoA hydratase-related protein [Temperatibacter marinus]WND03801.1 enoyl-CoA hydratase-related protein [Temperatibacter marinus]
MSYNTILLDKHDNVAVITLNRPEALNALNAELLGEVVSALKEMEADSEIGCMIITGSDKAFAAGADIKEMAEQSMTDMMAADVFGHTQKAFMHDIKKPVIAAVNGYALGGGCELAMLCDFILAGETAKFGQPEINLGVIPGIGGSQRLTKLIGKSKAMDMMLTGRMMDANEAERAGLASRIFPTDDLVDEAIKVAGVIAGKSLPSVVMAKETVIKAVDIPTQDGVDFEKRCFYSLFSTEDQKEGMAAFVEKRQPNFKNK